MTEGDPTYQSTRVPAVAGLASQANLSSRASIPAAMLLALGFCFAANAGKPPSAHARPAAERPLADAINASLDSLSADAGVPDAGSGGKSR